MPGVTSLPLSRPLLRPVPEEGVVVVGYVGLRVLDGPRHGECEAGFVIDGKVAHAAPIDELDEEITIEVHLRRGHAFATRLVLAMFRALTSDVIRGGQVVSIGHHRADAGVAVLVEPGQPDQLPVELGHQGSSMVGVGNPMVGGEGVESQRLCALPNDEVA